MKSYSTINIFRIFYSIILFVFLSNVTILSQAPLHPSLLKKYQSEKSFQNKTPIFKDKKALLEKGIDAPWAAPELEINKSPKVNNFQRSFGPARTPSGSWKALVILVQFSDQPTQTNAQTFDDLLFGTNFGSMRDYYKKVSYNNLDIITLNLPSSVGWLQVSQPYSYYVDNQNGFGNYPTNAQGLVEEVVRLADPLIDYSKYDNDGDGFVDALFVVHTGTGAEYGGLDSQIWSHAWAVPNPILLDGIKIYRYSMEPEFWLTPGDMTMGVYAHELGHAAFGLPDVYDTDYSSNGLGDWSLMAGGSWNGTGIGGNYPALPDAWSHAQMGYLNPTLINSNSSNLSLPAIETSSTAYILWENGNFINEYFLIENRQKTGYDQYLPGDGILVYHVDENVMTQNDYEWFPESLSSNHYLVAIEQADGLWNLEGRGNSNRGDSGDPFPGGTNKRNFNSFTVPDTKDYQSNFTGISIANISNSSSSMTADFNTLNTEPILALNAPQDGISLESGRKFQIKWASLNIQNVKIEYTTNNGTSWNLISDNETASNGQYEWIVPFVNSTECKIKITDRSNPNIYATNSNPFIIVEWKKDYLVWEPDPTPLSGIAIKNILESKGYSVAYSTGLFPELLYPYKGIFICLGVYPNNYRLKEAEAAFFISYLKQGGNIYMEGAETWASELLTSLHPYFNINGIDDGTSDLASVSGGSGTIMEGLIFNYSGENNYIDRLEPINNATTIFTNTSLGYGCAIMNEGNGYRTIGSSFEFGGLVDQGNLNTKTEVIKRILGFFNEVPNKPTNLSANLNKSNGLVSLNWNFTRNNYSVYEDFSDGLADNFNLEDNRFTVDEGYLKMNGLSNDSWATTYYNNDFSNFALEYGFKRVQGSPDYSVAAFIRADKAMDAGNEKGYLFCVTTSGSFYACKILNGSIMWYRPWSYTSAINTDVGANNIVTIGAMANNLKLIINGNEVFSIIDDLPEPILNGRIFIGAYDPSVSTNEVWWDFITVDENLASSVMALNLPKSEIQEIGGTSLVKSPEVNFPPNSVPAISVLDQIKSKEQSSELQNFFVYRDDAVIGNTKNTHYDDQLTEFGTYDYKVTALIDNIETEASNIRSVEYKYELALLHPTANDLVLSNSTYDIKWEGFIDDKVKIEYSTNNGADWNTIVSEVPLLDKQYRWDVPNLNSSECKIKISSVSNPNYFSVNEGVFVIRTLQIINETEDNGTLALANIVSIGDTISAIIANSNDVDYYKFYGVAGDTIDIYGDGTESGLGGRLSLLFNGNWLEQSQD
ncbi:MAG: M6 family metalloprotease domain-containing protein, partial [Melioribacteraceae bacterium]|nr:M6 family metalloprotease domain-containing protein [Melioribacteraceae bacterium]